jgi:hypothetical protein
VVKPMPHHGDTEAQRNQLMRDHLLSRIFQLRSRRSATFLFYEALQFFLFSPCLRVLW